VRPEDDGGWMSRAEGCMVELRRGDTYKNAASILAPRRMGKKKGPDEPLRFDATFGRSSREANQLPGRTLRLISNAFVH
jgi:hypothetical protein